jgi:hypothetical protein
MLESCVVKVRYTYLVIIEPNNLKVGEILEMLNDVDFSV